MIPARHQTARNAALLFLTEVAVKALGMILSILLARKLGVQKFGLFAFAYAISHLLLVLPGFGFDRLTQREVARRPLRASRFFVNISALKCVSYIPLAVLCALPALFSPDRGRLFIILIVFFDSVARHHLGFGCAFFRAIHKMEREALVRFILAAVSAVTGVAIIMAGFGLETLVASRLALSLGCLGLTILLMRKDLGITFVKVNWRYARVLLRLSAPLALLSVLVIIYGSINVTLLGLIKGEKETGYYYAAENIISVFLFIPAAVSAAAFPVLSRLWRESRESFSRMYGQSARYLVLLAVPLSVGTLTFGGEVMGLVFGRAYQPAEAVMTVLALCLVPDFLCFITSTALVAMNKHKAPVLGATVGAVVAPVACLIFIPLWGAVGAAFALVTATATVAVCQTVALSRVMPEVVPFGSLARSAAASALMLATLLPLHAAGLPVLAVVAASAPVYGGVLFILGEIRPHEAREALDVLLRLARSFSTWASPAREGPP